MRDLGSRAKARRTDARELVMEIPTDEWKFLFMGPFETLEGVLETVLATLLELMLTSD